MQALSQIIRISWNELDLGIANFITIIGLDLQTGKHACLFGAAQ